MSRVRGKNVWTRKSYSLVIIIVGVSTATLNQLTNTRPTKLLSKVGLVGGISDNKDLLDTKN